MTRPGLLAAFALLAADTAPAADPRRHLFLDPAFVSEARNLTLAVQPPQRRETVVVPDLPWEKLMISFYTTVRDEGGRIRLWYICRDAQNRPNFAYAESADGVHFTKPSLGLADYDGGRDNNLVGLTSLEGAPFVDPNAPAAERYACLTSQRDGLVRFFSPDGLRWQRDATPLLRYGSDTQNVCFWDANLGRYVLYFRGWDASQPIGVRTVLRTTFAKLTDYVDVPYSRTGRHVGGDASRLRYAHDEFPCVFRADTADPARTDVYNMSAQPYPLDPAWYVAFPAFLRRSEASWDPAYKGSHRGPVETQFAGSRDGIAWHRYDRAAYAGPGPAAPERKQMLFLGTGLVVRGDELWHYGTEFESEHGDMEARRRKTDGVIVRFVQRVDGFVALVAGNDEGTARTAAVRVTGSRLLLNLDTGALGEARVALLGADGRALPGFGFDACAPLTINATGAAVEWKGGANLASLVGQEVRVALRLRRAKLFSFRFE